MQFNSLQFVAFFIIVFLLYLALNHKWQNLLLLVASCVFYAAWDWRFLSLIFISITTDYFCGLRIGESESARVKKRLLLLSILVNLAILGLFKYFNFFLGNLKALLAHIGIVFHGPALKIIFPLGISFYTLKTMSYTIDIYREHMEPTRNYLDYALYVTFFPQLIAGPIARAKEFLPQILTPRRFDFDRFYEGSYLIFWGFFQKISLADNLAMLVDNVFNAPPPYKGPMALLAIYAFALQLYCDFAGYSNIAIGLGKCMGFETPMNFNLPYFATNAVDFWRRWHMTLSSWLRDYVYTPIVVSLRDRGAAGVGIAVMATFLICGLWHGAAWTFLAWGAYNGVLIILYGLLQPFLQRVSAPKNPFIANIWFIIKVVFFFHLMCLGGVFFRAESMGQAFHILKSISVCDMHMYMPYLLNIDLKSLLLIVCFYIIIEFYQWYKGDVMAVYKSHYFIKAIIYLVCFYLIILYGALGEKEFIYVRF